MSCALSKNVSTRTTQILMSRKHDMSIPVKRGLLYYPPAFHEAGQEEEAALILAIVPDQRLSDMWVFGGTCPLIRLTRS